MSVWMVRLVCALCCLSLHQRMSAFTWKVSLLSECMPYVLLLLSKNKVWQITLIGELCLADPTVESIELSILSVLEVQVTTRLTDCFGVSTNHQLTVTAVWVTVWGIILVHAENILLKILLPIFIEWAINHSSLVSLYFWQV